MAKNEDLERMRQKDEKAAEKVRKNTEQDQDRLNKAIADMTEKDTASWDARREKVEKSENLSQSK